MTDSSQSSSNPITHALSRRDLFRTARLAAGGAVLLGFPKFIGGWANEAAAAVNPGQVASIRIALELDGTTTFLRSVEGGNAFVEVVQGAGDLGKQPGAVRFEDILIDVDIPLSDVNKPLKDWIAATLTKTPVPKNGAIVYGDINLTEVKRLEFFNAAVSEVGVPACDAASATKEPLALTLRITPQSTRLAGGTGKKLQSAIAPKATKILSSNFRFNVQGLEQACKHIAKVERLTAKRLLAVSAAPGTEKFRQPQSQLGPLDCSVVSIFLPEADAGPLYAWFDDFVLKGKNGPGTERAALLEWLDPSLKQVMASVQLGGLGIVRYAPEPVKVGVGTLSQVRVDMYCETMNLTL